MISSTNRVAEGDPGAKIAAKLDLERARHGKLWTWSVLMAAKLSGPLLDLHAFGPDSRSAHPWGRMVILFYHPTGRWD